MFRGVVAVAGDVLCAAISFWKRGQEEEEEEAEPMSRILK